MSPSAKIGSALRSSRTIRCPLPHWMLVLAVAVAGVTCAWGNDASISANLVDPVVDAGQPAEYHIDITNARADEAPPAPTVEGLSIAYAGESQSRQYSFDGSIHSSTTYTYVYSIETSHPGRFVIPGQDVRVGRETLAVPPVTLNVMGSGGPGGTSARQSYFVALVIPKKNAYIGESIPAEVRVYFGWDVVANVDPSPILSGDGFSVQKFTPPRTSITQLNGEQFRVATYKTSLAGVKTGTISVGPAEVSPVVRLPRATRRRSRGNDPFEDPFFNDPLSGMQQAPARQVTLRSEPVTVEIKALPPGRPADFSGAIGQFKLEAEANPRKAVTGDPITVRLVLHGQGNFDRIEPPVLTDDAGLRTYPATSKFKTDDEVGLSGSKNFEQVLIAEGARLSLPGYHFSYLDPATGSYQSLQTLPVPVTITGAAVASQASAGAAVPGTPSSPPPAIASPAKRTPADILPIRPDFGRALDASAFLPVYERRPFWEVQGGALLLICALGSWARWMSHRQDAATRRAAELQRQRLDLSRTLREEDTGRVAFYSAARRLAQLKAAAASNQPEANLTSADICRAKQLPPEVAGSVEHIFQRHDELVYSGSAAGQEPVPAEERQAVLATLETLGKR